MQTCINKLEFDFNEHVDLSKLINVNNPSNTLHDIECLKGTYKISLIPMYLMISLV